MTPVSGSISTSAAWFPFGQVCPVCVADAVTVYFGYGRTRAGRVGTGIGYDGYQIRTADAQGFAGGDVRRTGQSMLLASTQGHHAMEGRAIVRAGSLEEYRHAPDFAQHMAHAPAPEPILVFRAESHLLSFHLGTPQANRVEWHDLAAWLDEPGPRFVVMGAEYVYPAGEIVTRRRLVEVGRLEQFTGAKPAKPLVFLRTAD